MRRTLCLPSASYKWRTEGAWSSSDGLASLTTLPPYVSTLRPEKWLTFCWLFILKHCLKEKNSILILILLKFVPKASWQYAITGSCKGLVPNGWQAIAWTNDDPVHWHTYASTMPQSWWRHQMETFPRYWPFVRGITVDRWILLTKASDAELWCFL